jgi:iron complex transport system permease protein
MEVNVRKKLSKKTIYLYSSLLIILVISAIVSIAFGARLLTFNELYNGIFNPEVDPFITSIIRSRVPRTIFGLCCGIALGISGALMQAVTRNPLSDPSILGVNTGAALFVVCGMSFFSIERVDQYIWFAIIGALITSIFVYSIGSLGKGGATPIKLVLAGTATSAALTSLISAILMPRGFVIDNYRFWQIGSIGAGTWNSLLTFLPFLIIGVVVAVLSANSLNALSLGDDAATGLGVNTTRLRLFAIIAAVMLCGATTAIAGPIGFVGLLAPHLIRLVVGSNYKLLIPLSAFTGASILVFADVIGRILGSPGELEVGIITALIGAPILIVFAIRSKEHTI